MILLDVDGGTDNSLCLHYCDFRICNRKTASAMTHHRVELVERSNDSLDVLNGLALCLCKSGNVSFLCRYELVKRRIKETDCYRATLKSLIEFLEVSLLKRKNLIKSGFALFLCVGADHLAERGDSVGLEEHVLCTAEADTFCAELTSLLRICGCVGICADLELSVLVSPCHNAAELTCYLSIYCRYETLVDVTCCTVDGDRVTLIEGNACECESLVLLIHVDVTAA